MAAFIGGVQAQSDETGPAVVADRLLFYSSPGPDGVYPAGSTVRIAVPFGEAVVVTTTGGVPELALTVISAVGDSLRTAGYDEQATRAAHDAVAGAADNDVVVFSYRAPTGDREADIRIANDDALSLGDGQITDQITDLRGNPASSLSLAGGAIRIRAYQLSFSPPALRTVAGAESDEQTSRTLTLAPLPGSIAPPGEIQIRVGAATGGGNLGGVSVLDPDGGDLTGGGLTFTPENLSRSIRVRVSDGPEQLRGGVTLVEASFAGHSGTPRGDQGVRVTPATLPVGVVPLVEEPPLENVRRFILTFDDSPVVTVGAGTCEILNLTRTGIGGASIDDDEFVGAGAGYASDAEQHGVTAEYTRARQVTDELGGVKLCAATDAPGSFGVLTATSYFYRTGFFNPGRSDDVEITPASIGVHVRPLDDVPPARRYELAFTPRSLGVLAGESAAVTVMLHDPSNPGGAVTDAGPVSVALTLHGGAGSVSPESVTLSAAAPSREISVTVDGTASFADSDRTLLVTAEAGETGEALIAAAQLAVTVSQPTLELTFNPRTPLTVPIGGGTQTVTLQLSEPDGAALPPAGTTLLVPVELRLGGDRVHVSPASAVLAAEVTGAGLTAASVDVKVWAESASSPQSLGLTATPGESGGVRVVPGALAVNTVEARRRFGFRFTRFWDGEQEREFEENAREYLDIRGPDDRNSTFPFEYYEDNGTTATLSVSNVAAWTLDNQNRGVPSSESNLGGARNISGVVLELTGDELEEGESVTATLTWYISEAGSAADNYVLDELIQVGWNLARAARGSNSGSDSVAYVPDDTTWVWMWESPGRFFDSVRQEGAQRRVTTQQGQRLLTDLYSRQAEVVFTRDKPEVYLSMYSFYDAPPAPLALEVSVSDDRRRALNAAFSDGSLGVGVRHLQSAVTKEQIDVIRMVLDFDSREICLRPGEQKTVNLRWHTLAGDLSERFSGRTINPRLAWGSGAATGGPGVISVEPLRLALTAAIYDENQEVGGWFPAASRELTITAAADAPPGESLVLRAMPEELWAPPGMDPSVLENAAAGGGVLNVCILPREFDLAFTPAHLSLLQGSSLPVTVGLEGSSLDGDESVNVSLGVLGGGGGVRVEPPGVTLGRGATTATFRVVAPESAPVGTLAVVASVSGDQQAALEAIFNAGVLPVEVTDEDLLRQFDLSLTPVAGGDAARLRWNRATTVTLSVVPQTPFFSLADDESVTVTVSLAGSGLGVRVPGGESASSVVALLDRANGYRVDLALSVARDFASRDDPPQSRLLSAEVSLQTQEALGVLFTSATLEVEVVRYDLEAGRARNFTLSFARDSAGNREIAELPLTAAGRQEVYLRLTPDEGSAPLSGSERAQVDLVRNFGSDVTSSPGNVIFARDDDSFALEVIAGVNAPRQTAILSAGVSDARARALDAHFTPAFLDVEVTPLVAQPQVLQERSYQLRFDSASVELTAGGPGAAEVRLMMTGDDPLTPGESATVTLVLDDADTGLAVSPREVRLDREITSATVTLGSLRAENRARSASLRAEVAAAASRIPGAVFNSVPLQLNVIRGVTLTFTHAAQGVLQIDRGATAAVTVSTIPPLAGGESVAATLTLAQGTGNVLNLDRTQVTLSGDHPAATVVVTALQSRREDTLRALSVAGQGVDVLGAVPLAVETSLAPNVSLVFEPNPVEVQQGRGAMFLVTTDPPLDAASPDGARSATVNLQLEKPTLGFAPDDSHTVSVALDGAMTAGSVEVRAPASVAPGGLFSVVVTARDVLNFRFRPFPELTIRVTRPRVTVSVEPATESSTGPAGELVIERGEGGVVAVRIPGGQLRSPQQAVLRVETEGAGVGVLLDQVTLNASNEFEEFVEVSATEEDLSATLRVSALSGAEFTPVELPIRVVRAFAIAFDPASLEIPAGTSSPVAVRLENFEALDDGERVVVEFSKEDPNSIIADAPSPVTLTKDRPATGITVAAAWRRETGSTANLVPGVAELRNARFHLPLLQITNAAPEVGLDLEPSDALTLAVGGSAEVRWRVDPPLQGEQTGVLLIELLDPVTGERIGEGAGLGFVKTDGATTDRLAINLDASSRSAMLSLRAEQTGRTALLRAVVQDGARSETVQINVRVKRGLKLSFDPPVETIPVGASTPVTVRLTKRDDTAVTESELPDGAAVTLRASPGLRLAPSPEAGAVPGAGPSSSLTVALTAASASTRVIVTADTATASVRAGDEWVAASAAENDYASFESSTLTVSAPLPAELILKPAERLLVAPGGSTMVTVRLRGDPLRGDRRGAFVVTRRPAARAIFRIEPQPGGYQGSDFSREVSLNENNPRREVRITAFSNRAGAAGALRVSSTRILILNAAETGESLPGITQTTAELAVQALQHVSLRFVEEQPLFSSTRIIAGRSPKTAEIEIVPRDSGAELTGYERVGVNLSNTDAVGELRFEPSVFVLGGAKAGGAPSTRRVTIGAGARTRGPVRDGRRQITTLTAELNLLGVETTAALPLAVVPEFRVGFSPTTVTLIRGRSGADSRPFRVGLVGEDTSLPVVGSESITVARVIWDEDIALYWPPDVSFGLLFPWTFDGDAPVLELTISVGDNGLEGSYQAQIPQANFTLSSPPPYADVDPLLRFAPSVSAVTALAVEVRERAEFTVQFEPAAEIEVEQGRSATFAVTTDPVLIAGESAVATLTLADPQGVTFGGESRLEVALSDTLPSSVVEVSAPPAAEINALISGSVSLDVTSPNGSPGAQPSFSVKVVTPRVELFPEPGELVLSQNGEERVNVAAGGLAAPQRAVFEVIVPEDLASSLTVTPSRFTLAAPDFSTELTVAAGDFRGLGGSGELTFRAIAGVELREEAGLDVQVNRRVELRFMPDRLTLVRGGPAQPVVLEVVPRRVLRGMETFGVFLSLVRSLPAGYEFAPDINDVLAPMIDVNDDSAVFDVNAGPAAIGSATLELDDFYGRINFGNPGDYENLDVHYGALSLAAINGVNLVLATGGSPELSPGASLEVKVSTDPLLQGAERTTATLALADGLVVPPGGALSFDEEGNVELVLDEDNATVLVTVSVDAARTPGESLTLNVSGEGDGVAVLGGDSLTLRVVRPRVAAVLAPETGSAPLRIPVGGASTAILSLAPGTLAEDQEAVFDVAFEPSDAFELAGPARVTLTATTPSTKLVVRALTPAVAGTLRVTAAPSGDVGLAAPAELALQALQRVTVRFAGGSVPRVVPGAAATSTLVELVADPASAALTGYEVVEVTLSGTDAVGDMTFTSATFTLNADSTRREVSIAADARTRGPVRDNLRRLTTLTADLDVLGAGTAASLPLAVVPEFFFGFSRTEVTLIRGDTDPQMVSIGLREEASFPVAGESMTLTTVHGIPALPDIAVFTGRGFDRHHPARDFPLVAGEGEQTGDYTLLIGGFIISVSPEYAPAAEQLMFAPSVSTSTRTSLVVKIRDRREFSAEFDPAAELEVEQGRSATFAVTTDPRLGDGESATVTLTLADPRGVTLGGGDNLVVPLSEALPSSVIAVTVPRSLPIGSTVAVSAALTVVTPDSNAVAAPGQPSLAVKAAAPRVALSLTSYYDETLTAAEPLFTAQNTSTPVKVTVAGGELEFPQAATFAVTVPPSLASSLTVTPREFMLSAPDFAATVMIVVDDFHGLGGSGTLTFDAVVGARLREAAGLGVLVRRRVELRFTPDELTLVRGAAPQPVVLELGPRVLRDNEIFSVFGLHSLPPGYTFDPSLRGFSRATLIDHNHYSRVFEVSAGPAADSATLNLGEIYAQTFITADDYKYLEVHYGGLSLTAVSGVNVVLEPRGLPDDGSLELIPGASLEVKVATDPLLQGAERTTATLALSDGLRVSALPGILRFDTDGDAEVALSADNPAATVTLSVDRDRRAGESLTLSASGEGEGVTVFGAAALTVRTVNARGSAVVAPETGDVPLRVPPGGASTAVLSFVPESTTGALPRGQEAVFDVAFEPSDAFELAGPARVTLTAPTLSTKLIVRSLKPVIAGTLRVTAAPDGVVELTAPAELALQALELSFAPAAPVVIEVGASTGLVLAVKPPLTGVSSVAATLAIESPGGEPGWSLGGADPVTERVAVTLNAQQTTAAVSLFALRPGVAATLRATAPGVASALLGLRSVNASSVLLTAPPAVEVEQGGYATFRLGVSPRLGPGQSATVTLGPASGLSGGENEEERVSLVNETSSGSITFEFTAAGAPYRDFDLYLGADLRPPGFGGSVANPSAGSYDPGIEFRYDAVQGFTPRPAVGTPGFVDLTVLLRRIEADFFTSPTAASPLAELTLGNGESRRLTLRQTGPALRGRHEALLEVGVSGEGLSLIAQDGSAATTGIVRMSSMVRAVNLTALATQDGVSGALRVTARDESGVGLRAGFIELPVRVLSDLRVGFAPPEVTLVRGGVRPGEVSTTVKVFADPPLSAGRTLALSVFHSGGFSLSHDVVTLDDSKSSFDLTIGAGEFTSSGKIELSVSPVATNLPDTRVILEELPVEVLRGVNLTLAAGAPFITGEEKEVTVSTTPTLDAGEEVAVALAGQDLNLSEATLTLSHANPERTIRVRSDDTAAKVLAAMRTATTDVRVVAAASLNVAAFERLELRFDPLEIEQGGSATLRVATSPALTAGYSARVTLTATVAGWSFGEAAGEAAFSLDAASTEAEVRVNAAPGALGPTFFGGVEQLPRGFVFAPPPPLRAQAFRSLPLSFDPPSARVAAGASTRVAVVLGNAGSLHAGERLAVRLVPSAGLELAGPAPATVAMSATTGRVEVSLRAKLDADRAAGESLAASFASLDPDDQLAYTRVPDGLLAVTVLRREVTVAFDPSTLRLVRGGAAPATASALVSLKAVPALQSTERLVVSFSTAAGLTLPAPVTLTSMTGTVEAAVAAGPSASSGQVTANVVVREGDLVATGQGLKVEVVRGVGLRLGMSLGGSVSPPTLIFTAGESTVVPVTTSPVLTAGERVTVTVTADVPGLNFGVGKLVLDGAAPAGELTLRSEIPNLDAVLTAAGVGEGVAVVAGATRRVTTRAANNVAVIIEPDAPRIAVEQAGSARVTVKTSPELAVGQSLTFDLALTGDGGNLHFNGGSTEVEVTLDGGGTSSRINVNAPVSAVIGATARLSVAGLPPDQANLGVSNRDNLPSRELAVAPPRVTVGLTPVSPGGGAPGEALVLGLGETGTVTVSLSDYVLAGGQRAVLEARLDGAGLSFGAPGVVTTRVTLTADNSTADVTVRTAADALPGVLNVRAVGGVELKTPASLAVNARQVISLSFTPLPVEVEQGRDASLSVGSRPRIAAGRSATVTVTAPEGVFFDGGAAFTAVFDGAAQSRDVPVAALYSAPLGATSAAVSVRASRGLVVEAAPSTIALNVTTPQVTLSLSPASLILAEEERGEVGIRLRDYVLKGGQRAGLRASVAGDLRLQGVTGDAQDLELSAAAPVATVTVTALETPGDAPGAGTLTVTATGGVGLSQEAALAVVVLELIEVTFTPARVEVEQGGSAVLTVSTDPPLGPMRSATVTLAVDAASGVTFDGNVSLEVPLGAAAGDRAEIVVAASPGAPPGPPAAGVEITARGEGEFALDQDLPELAVNVVDPRVAAVSFDPGGVRLVRGGAAGDTASTRVTLRVDPELFGEEQIEVRLVPGGGLTVTPRVTTLSSRMQTVEVTVEAGTTAASSEVRTLPGAGTSFGGANVTFGSLSVEVVRGVNLVIAGAAGGDELIIVAGESTEVSITTDPPLEAGERVVVTLESGNPGLELGVTEVTLSGSDDVVATVTVTAKQPDLTGVAVSAAGKGEGVVVVAGDALSVDTLVASEVAIAFEPESPVEVEQGRAAEFIVNTVPPLGANQTVTVTLMMEQGSHPGLSFGENGTRVELVLGRGGRAVVAAAAAATAPLGSTARSVVSAAAEPAGGLSVTSAPPLELVVTTPRVTLAFVPYDELFLTTASTGAVTIGLNPDDSLQPGQSATLVVTVEGAGLSLEGAAGDGSLEVSLSAGSTQAEVVVGAAADAVAAGVLRVRAALGAGVRLREGTTTTLAVSVAQPVRLVFDPPTLEIERGRRATFSVTTDPALTAERSGGVTLEASAGFGFGVYADARRVIVLSAAAPTTVVGIGASTRTGVQGTVIGAIAGVGVSQRASSPLDLISVTPVVTLSLTPLAGPPGNLALTIGEAGVPVRVGLADYTLLSEQTAEVQVTAAGGGLTVEPSSVTLSENVQEARVVVTAADEAGVSGILRAAASGDVSGAPAALGVSVTQRVGLEISPSNLGIPSDGVASFTVRTSPALSRERSVTVTLSVPAFTFGGFGVSSDGAFADRAFVFDAVAGLATIGLGEAAGGPSARVFQASFTTDAELPGTDNLGLRGTVGVDDAVPSAGVSLRGGPDYPRARSTWTVVAPSASVVLTPDSLRLTPGSRGTVTLSLGSYFDDYILNPNVRARLEVEITGGQDLDVEPKSIELDTNVREVRLIVTAAANAESGALTVRAADNTLIGLTPAETVLNIQIARGARLRVRVFLEGALE